MKQSEVEYTKLSRETLLSSLGEESAVTDEFLIKIYDYYNKKGFQCWIISEFFMVLYVSPQFYRKNVLI
jgi:hypothetical protein